ncbi:MAG: hypothetical protein J6C87_02595 [Bacteroides sp.]|nr:hypothetical protein [Bacteroides sp.]
MATTINSLPMSQLTLGSHSDFHTRVNNLITATGAEELHVATQAAQYAEAVAVEASLVKRETTFVATEIMKQADKTRDHLLGVVNSVVQAHAYNPIAEKAEAYNYLSAVIAPYKGIAAHEYSRQTSEVNGLVTALSTTDGAKYIALLGLTTEVEQLALANAQFSVEFDKKTAEVATRAPKSDISSDDARLACDNLYNEMVQLMNAYALIQPTDTLTTFITELNGIVETYRTIAANTGKSSSTKTEDTTTGDSSTTTDGDSTSSDEGITIE